MFTVSKIKQLANMISYEKELSYFKDNFIDFFNIIKEKNIQCIPYEYMKPFQILYYNNESSHNNLNKIPVFRSDMFFYLGQKKNRLYFVKFFYENADIIIPDMCFCIPTYLNNNHILLNSIKVVYDNFGFYKRSFVFQMAIEKKYLVLSNDMVKICNQ